MRLQGKIAVVTGANTGIGRVTARELAREGAHVFLACRSPERAAGVLLEIAELGGRAEVVPLNLASLRSVELASQRLAASVPRIDVLVNNAGVAGLRALTEDGFEATFGINHLGHFALTMRLLPKLSGARVITVSSHAHRNAKGIDFGRLRTPAGWMGAFPAYSASKLANILFARELGRRVPELRSYSLHPGVVKTEIWRQIPRPFRGLVTARMIGPEAGAKTSLHCAISEEAGRETRLYYSQSAPLTPGPRALDDALAEELWERSVAWTGAKTSTTAKE